MLMDLYGFKALRKTMEFWKLFVRSIFNSVPKSIAPNKEIKALNLQIEHLMMEKQNFDEHTLCYL